MLRSALFLGALALSAGTAFGKKSKSCEFTDYDGEDWSLCKMEKEEVVRTQVVDEMEVYYFPGRNAAAPDCPNNEGSVVLKIGSNECYVAGYWVDETREMNPRAPNEDVVGKEVVLTLGDGDDQFVSQTRAKTHLQCAKKKEIADEEGIDIQVSYDYDSLNRITTYTVVSTIDCGKWKVRSSGMSGGWVFILILFISTLVYCLAGAAYKAKRHGARGVEAVPNIDFWRDLPGLVKDGCKFTVAKLRGKSTDAATGNYETF
ncbi:MAG: hypothetical protein MHM6MM_008504 [Cercozoa sp. M6MM]